ncbi:signal peptidase II [Tessaracoccus antarcticus]|uniref:Lipoprotein signal peptidase n=1 Tax=Tessaracoccus antarcticus TaxID=2479848 RepID=A0A3M0G6Y1_9ACTN|nr:signal peptidase II [Tessaracoccus antarcticus]RMB60268.1 signal peptidase II [Tessaracoccus antarcticus]
MQAARGTTLTAARWRPALLLAIGVGVLGYSLDQLTKWLAVKNLVPRQPVEVLGPVLRLTLIRNPGAAFSMGSNSTVALSIFAIVALLACLVVGMPRVRTMSQGLALGLLTAGIAGNLHDRLTREPSPLRGHVIDFFQLPYFAIFNVADICITSAAVLVIWLGFRDTRAAKPAAPAAQDPDA